MWSLQWIADSILEARVFHINILAGVFWSIITYYQGIIIRDGHQNLNFLWIDLNQVHLIGPVERNILVFKSSKSDVPLQSYGF